LPRLNRILALKDLGFSFAWLVLTGKSICNLVTNRIVHPL
jgi:hypothetical protein